MPTPLSPSFLRSLATSAVVLLPPPAITSSLASNVGTLPLNLPRSPLGLNLGDADAPPSLLALSSASGVGSGLGLLLPLCSCSCIFSA